ncbi:MAG: NHLP family bacteriocin export ABC transporter peptidase/permease/ATPase subunit [Desulfobacterales bacterium]|nr:NHLP family bacteriocin export ABC transporter peptidase/permease/ATPase subunit [Desulfobacterales bacterium]
MVLTETNKRLWHNKRVKTPTVLQMETTECGAAALCSVLSYYGRIEPLEKLRTECDVSRDGSKASNVVKVAQKYGLIAKGFRKEPKDLKYLPLPMIIFWNFNHFVVLEGIKGKKVYLNDPAFGPKIISYEEFDQSFTGVVLTFTVGPDFKKGGKKSSMISSLASRLKGSKTVLMYVLLAGLFLVIPGIIIPSFSTIFIDDILVSKMTGRLKPLLVGMGVVALIRAILTWLQSQYLLRFETKLAISSSAKFFLHVFRLPIEFFSQRFGGEIGNRVLINDNIAQLLSRELASNALNIVTVIFFTILMIQYDLILTITTIAIAAINLLVLKIVSQKRKNVNEKYLMEQGKMIGTTMAGLQMIETLKATGTESDFFSQWSGYFTKVAIAQQELGITNQIITTIPPFLSSLNTLAILTIGSLRVMEGDLSIGMLVAFQTLMSSFIAPINQMVNLASKLQEFEGNMKRLDDVLGHSVDISFKDEQNSYLAENDNIQVKLSGNIEIRNVAFGYSKLSPPLIENFNLTLKPGSRIAIVGCSGSGKSTIAKIVSGLYAPWSGEILFDGKKREDIPKNIFANSVAMVDQTIFMFEGTIRENLTIWDKTIPEAQIINAAKDACIHDEISIRVGGYESKVDEMGNNFSGGQRQRLEIARALVMNPSIIILDEATSSLDPITEKIIDDNLRKRGCTIIIIAHRLSTIRDCDEIILLERGKVVQRGAHDNLIKEDGPYLRLIKNE